MRAINAVGVQSMKRVIEMLYIRFERINAYGGENGLEYLWRAKDPNYKPNVIATPRNILLIMIIGVFVRPTDMPG